MRRRVRRWKVLPSWRERRSGVREVRGEEAEGLMGREHGNLMTHMDFNDRVSVFLAIAIYWRVFLVCGFCMVLGVVCHRLNSTFILLLEKAFRLVTTCFHFCRNVI